MEGVNESSLSDRLYDVENDTKTATHTHTHTHTHANTNIHNNNSDVKMSENVHESERDNEGESEGELATLKAKIISQTKQHGLVYICIYTQIYIYAVHLSSM
jgi:hypothetical protein